MCIKEQEEGQRDEEQRKETLLTRYLYEDSSVALARCLRADGPQSATAVLRESSTLGPGFKHWHVQPPNTPKLKP